MDSSPQLLSTILHTILFCLHNIFSRNWEYRLHSILYWNIEPFEKKNKMASASPKVPVYSLNGSCHLSPQTHINSSPTDIELISHKQIWKVQPTTLSPHTSAPSRNPTPLHATTPKPPSASSLDILPSQSPASRSIWTANWAGKLQKRYGWNGLLECISCWIHCCNTGFGLWRLVRFLGVLDGMGMPYVLPLSPSRHLSSTKKKLLLTCLFLVVNDPIPHKKT